MHNTTQVLQQPHRGAPLTWLSTRMAHCGVIFPSQSDCASPVVLAPKPDGGLHKLNVRTKKDSYPIPRMDVCTDTSGDAAVFTTLEANSGYLQVKIPE